MPCGCRELVLNVLDLIEIAKKALHGSLDVYDARLQSVGEGFHLDIELDNLADRRGAVNLQDCETYSRRLVEILDSAIESQDQNILEGLPPEFTEENYSISVESAGAERILRLPGDLDRFKDLPLKVRYSDGETVHADLMVYFSSENDMNGLVFLFKEFNSKRRKKKSGKSKNGRSSARENSRSDPEDLVHRIHSGDILEVRLFLDF